MGKKHLLAAMLMAAGTGTIVRAEIIGSYDIVAAPIDARLVAGGQNVQFGYLNIVNAPVTIEQAFTGFSILDDGYANGAAGTTIEVEFTPGLVKNNPGPDLVLFEARYDAGEYRIRTDYDGFATALFLGAADFADTGVDRAYYYQHATGGPYNADIYAAAFDLSDLGVPDGATIERVRFEATNDATDPIGLGMINNPVPEPATLVLLAAAPLLTRRRRARA